MRQRVVIALAISCEPDLIIADEPTTALDVSIQYQILELLKDLTKKRNLGVIIITHDMGVIAETTDKVIVMRYGHIVEQGETKELLTNPKSTEARSLVISVPPTNKKIDRFKLISPDGKEITSSSKDLTKNIIKTWGIRENKNQKLLKLEEVTKVFDDNSLVSPCSTIRPYRITITLSVVSAITPISWVIIITPRFLFFVRSLRSSKTVSYTHLTLPTTYHV